MWTPTPRAGRRGLQAALLALAWLAGACGSKAPPKAGRPAVTVTLDQVRRASVPYTIVANGIVTPLQSATVAAQVDGLVTEVAFREGQDVAKGQLLFRIDARPYEAAYQQALSVLARDKATADNARAQFERYNALVSGGVVTREQADQMRATAQSTAAIVGADSAALKTAKFNLDNTTIRAPIAGRTGALLVREGNLVRAGGGTPLVVINQVKPILVRFAAPSSELRNILTYGKSQELPVVAGPSTATAQAAPAPDTARRGDGDAASRARAVEAPGGKADADPNSYGKLYFIDNAVDTTTGTVQLKATFPNAAGTLWAGQFVTTTLQLYVEENAIVVPAEAVVTGQRGAYVWVVDSSNAARERPVTVERTAGPLTIVTSGVSEGERVVTTGQSRLSPGAPVELRAPGEGGRVGRGARGAAPTEAKGNAKGDAKGDAKDASAPAKKG
ncbi:MAG: efflux RND transporter periplasmic adaptor subunit [Gemmatimonadetes bacterium]|nr:efflux RND transporter periplasmic adaptor subunit [Gemmatimonadota bacterium]